jgi:protein-S-isoprenylcysteine O-methyltransferase Ste14
MHILLFACLIGLHAGFLWARIAFFRIDGATPLGVRLIEAAGTASVLVGAVLTLRRDGDHIAADVAALGIASLSASLFAWGLLTVKCRQLTAAFSPDMPGELVTTGAFRHIRNPFYACYLLAHAMPVFASRSAWSLLPLAWMTGIYVRAALIEENKFLASPVPWPTTFVATCSTQVASPRGCRAGTRLEHGRCTATLPVDANGTLHR